MHRKKTKKYPIGRKCFFPFFKTLYLFLNLSSSLSNKQDRTSSSFFSFSREIRNRLNFSPWKQIALEKHHPHWPKSAREMASLRNGQRNGTSLINWTSCVGSRPTKIPVATISSHHRSSFREEECNRDPKSSDFEIARGPSTPLRHHFRWFSHLFAKSCSTLKSHVFSSWAQINLRLFGLLVLLFFFFFNKSKK